MHSLAQALSGFAAEVILIDATSFVLLYLPLILDNEENSDKP